MSTASVIGLRTTARLAYALMGLVLYGAGYISLFKFGSGAGDVLFIAPACVSLAAALLVIAFGPGRSRQPSIVAIVFVASWALAAVAGMMFAGCDLGMRSSISNLLFVFEPLALLEPPVAIVLIGSGVAIAWLIERVVGTRAHASTWTFTTVLLVAVVVAAIGVKSAVYAIASAYGVHPTPGACVI